MKSMSFTVFIYSATVLLIQPNPTHYMCWKMRPNPTQPNPCMDPTHVHLCARVITGSRKFDSDLSHILHHDLHWLDVPRRAIFKLCMTVYKCLHGLAPKYSPSCAFWLRMLPGTVN